MHDVLRANHSANTELMLQRSTLWSKVHQPVPTNNADVSGNHFTCDYWLCLFVCVEVMVVLAPNNRRISSKEDMMILHVIMLKPCIGLIPQQEFDF